MAKNKKRHKSEAAKLEAEKAAYAAGANDRQEALLKEIRDLLSKKA